MFVSHRLFYILLVFCCCDVHCQSPQCLASDGTAQDWWVAIKLPRNSNSADPKFVAGEAYVIITSSEATRDRFRLEAVGMSDPTSAISTRSGDLLSVLIKSMTAAGAGAEAQKLHTSLVAEVILELKESGTVLLE